MFRNPLTDGVVVLLVLLLFFGPKRLPMLSRSIGESIKEFKGGVASGAIGRGENRGQCAEEVVVPMALTGRDSGVMILEESPHFA